MSHVEVNAELCKGCGFCLAPCPQQILRLGEKANSKGYRYAEQLGERPCTACMACAISCPDSAITVFQEP